MSGRKPPALAPPSFPSSLPFRSSLSFVSRVSSGIPFYLRPTRLKRLEELSQNGFDDGFATSCSTCTEPLIEGLLFGSGPFSQSFPTVRSGEDGFNALKLVYVIGSGRSPSSTRSLTYVFDSLKVGALGSHELVQLAALTGSQTGNGLLQVQVRHLLDTWGSTLGSRFSTNKISMWYFRQVVSPAGLLCMTKAELRRTIRYAKAMDLCYLTPHGHDRWRSFTRALILREAPQ